MKQNLKKSRCQAQKQDKWIGFSPIDRAKCNDVGSVGNLSSLVRHQSAKKPMPYPCPIRVRPIIQYETISPSANYKDQPCSQRLLMKGLINFGNTCYLNSTLQCLIHTVPLQKYFMEMDISTQRSKELVCSFAELIDNMTDKLDTSVTRAEQFKITIEKLAPQFSGYGQQDAQEFLTFLLDGLHEELNTVIEKQYISMPPLKLVDAKLKEVAHDFWEKHKMRNNSKIVELFYGQIKNQYSCPTCHTEFTSFEPIIQITLPIPTVQYYETTTCIYSCLNFFIKERLTEDTCENCQSGKITKVTTLWRLPPILIIHLKRFEWSSFLSPSKVDTHVDLKGSQDNFSLNLDTYTSNKIELCNYKLYAVINHFGTLHFGHYTAYIKHQDKWFLCDDEETRIVSEDDVQKWSSRYAYVLFYEREEHRGTLV